MLVLSGSSLRVTQSSVKHMHPLCRRVQQHYANLSPNKALQTRIRFQSTRGDCERTLRRCRRCAEFSTLPLIHTKCAVRVEHVDGKPQLRSLVEVVHTSYCERHLKHTVQWHVGSGVVISWFLSKLMACDVFSRHVSMLNSIRLSTCTPDCVSFTVCSDLDPDCCCHM